MKSKVSNPKVSIVIPVYNGANFVGEAIKSALAQDYDNFEVLIVNDGSTDKTEEVCKSFTDKRIRYFKKENGGVSSALNFAIKKMRGEYFSWLSHDDLYLPSKVSDEIAYLQTKKMLYTNSIVFSGYSLIDKHGWPLETVYLDSSELNQKQEYAVLEGMINGLSLLIPKKAFLDCGDFSEELVAIQDYDLWWRFLKKYHFYYLNKSLVCTRCHSLQTTNTSPRVLTEGNAFYKEIIGSLSKKRKVALEGSEYAFYARMQRYFENTVHKEVSNFCKTKMAEILQNTEPESCEVDAIIFGNATINQLKSTIASLKTQSTSTINRIVVDSAITQDLESLKKEAPIVVVSEDLRASLESSSARYIIFVRAGDVLVSSAINTLLRLASATKAPLLYGRCKMADSGSVDKEFILTSQYSQRHLLTKMLPPSSLLLEGAWVKEHLLGINGSGFTSSNIYKFAARFPLISTMDCSGKTAYTLDTVAVLSNITMPTEIEIASTEERIKYILSLDEHNFLDYELTKLSERLIKLLKEKNSSLSFLDSVSKFKKIRFFLRSEGLIPTAKRLMTALAKKVLSALTLNLIAASFLIFA